MEDFFKNVFILKETEAMSGNVSETETAIETETETGTGSDRRESETERAEDHVHGIRTGIWTGGIVTKKNIAQEGEEEERAPQADLEEELALRDSGLTCEEAKTCARDRVGKFRQFHTVKVRRKDGKKKRMEEISGKEYTEKLKTRFEKITSGTPNWAKLPSERDDVSDADSDVEELLTSTGTHLVTSAALPPGVLQIKQCPDANADSPSKGKLTSVQFHPTAQVLLTAGTDQSLRLFQIDGNSNPKIQSVFLDNFPVMSARFSANGEEVVMGSKHRSFYYYDMMAGKVVFVPKTKGLGENNMARLRVSPDGRFIVFLGSYGNIHLVSAKTKEWIHTLKMNGSVEDITFSADGARMYSTGDDGRVYVWDLNSRQCLHNFIDDGCVHGTSIALSRDSQYLACGSNTGVVNVYNTDDCMLSRAPRPAKAIMNLTTSCSAAAFSPSTEILALASNFEEKAVKLVHFPSFSVFSNYPEPFDTKIRIPWAMDFSPNCGFFSIGNHKGRALLYR
nr:hypothetical protein BaRGS_016872 [Batillaria attramentaria]